MALTVLPTLLSFLSCNPADSDRGSDGLAATGESVAGGAVRDSSGVLITETTASVATAPLQWEIDSVPSLALGSEEREGEVFFGIRGLRGLPGGGVLVLDGGSQELRYFDSSGQLVRRVGRRGQGPGEFRLPYLVPTLRSDSLLVWDGVLRRFQLFSAAGELARTISLRGRWPSGLNPPLGAVGSIMLAYRPELTGATSYWAYGTHDEGFDFVWLEPATGTEVAIASFRIATSATIGRSGNIPVTAGIPFTTRPSAAVTDSSALVYDGNSPEIREHGMDGGVRRIFRVTGGFRRPADDEAIEGYFQYTLAVNPHLTRSKVEATFDAVPCPDTLPAFRSLMVDEAGWTWAEVYHWARARQSGRWMVFDPAGHARGILEVPDGLQIQRIGEDFLLGVRFDDLGVEEVLRYELRRGPKWERGNSPGRIQE